MKFFLRNAASLLIVSALTLPASAHPGHGEPGAAHYFTEPEHLFGFAAFAAVIFMMYYSSRFRRKARR